MSIVPGSPIRTFAADWGRLSLDGKRAYLVRSGQARDWHDASSLLSRHGHAVRRSRRGRKDARRERRAQVDLEAQAVVDRVESVTVRQTCQGCGALLAEITQHADGRRECVEHLARAPIRGFYFCGPCAVPLLPFCELEQRRVA